jgi:DNA-binding response OmpR family regulator
MTSPIRVLLAEDSRFLRLATTAVLEAQGFKIFGAPDGEQALEIAAKEDIDIVLLDLILPKVQGFEVLQRLRQDPRTVNVPVIIFTSITSQHDFSAYAPVDFISKDSFILDQLITRINDNLAKVSGSHQLAAS